MRRYSNLLCQSVLFFTHAPVYASNRMGFQRILWCSHQEYTVWKPTQTLAYINLFSITLRKNLANQ